MKQSDWGKITKARKILQLEETATLKQIKSAFRRMCKKHHPDLAADSAMDNSVMQEVHEAYDVLIEYCNSFHYPLTPKASGQPMEAEDWWMDRFGQDPLWGKQNKD